MLEELLSEMDAQGRKFTFLCGHDSTVASVLAALGAEDYVLPGAIEPSVPIGVKLVFEGLLKEKINLYYQLTDFYEAEELQNAA